MKTVLIGSGNVAYHLAKAFTGSGIKIGSLFGRNRAALEEISTKTGIPIAMELPYADLYLLAVSDGAVEEVSAQITHSDCLVAHTSGSLPKEILKGNYRKGSFYPMQTFSKIRQLDYSRIPFFIEAQNEADEETLFDMASKISSSVHHSTHETRKYLHLTAVFTCNFVNHLFTVGKDISDAHQIPFEVFHPLIEEAVAKIKFMEPKEAQTGPAVRGDFNVMDLHQQLIQEQNYLDIYRTLSRSILEVHGKK